MAVASAAPTGYGVYTQEDTGRVKVTTAVGAFDPQPVLGAIKKAGDIKVDIQNQKLQTINDKVKALQEIQSKFLDWKAALKDLRGFSYLPGQSGAFAYTTPSITGYAGRAGSEFVTASVDPGVEPTDFTFSINQLASKDSIMSNATVASDTTALNWSGNLVFPHVDGTSPDVTVTVATTMSLRDIRGMVNAVRDSIGLNAEVVPSGDAYKLAFTSSSFAKPIIFTNTIVGAGDQLPQQYISEAAGSVNNQNTARGWVGTITFPHMDGVSPDVVVNVLGSDSLTDIQNNINLQNANTNITASIDSTGGVYRLVYTHDSGKPVEVTNAVTGVTNELPETLVSTTASLSSLVTYRGEQSEHDSNTPKINGLLFNLIEETTQDLKFSLDYSPTLVVDAVQAWVDKHNDLVDVVRKYVNPIVEDMDATSEDEIQGGILASNAFMREMEMTLSTYMVGAVGGISGIGVPRYLADVGIVSKQGKLDLDVTTLLSKLGDDFKSVRNLFVFNSTSTNPNFEVTNHPSLVDESLSGKTTSLNLSRDGSGVLTAAFTITGDPTTYYAAADGIEVLDSGNSFMVRAPEGSPMAGMVLYYGQAISNGSSASTDITVSQGVSDMFYEKAKIWDDPVSGDFLLTEESFEDETDSVKEAITKLIQVQNLRMAEFERKMELVVSVMQQLQSTLNMAQAISKANDRDN